MQTAANSPHPTTTDPAACHIFDGDTITHTDACRDECFVSPTDDLPVPPVPAGFDLAAYAHPNADAEWDFGTDRGLWHGGYPVKASAEPDVDGHIVSFDRVGFTRDELPELIAFLTAVHAASEPADAEASVEPATTREWGTRYGVDVNIHPDRHAAAVEARDYDGELVSRTVGPWTVTA